MDPDALSELREFIAPRVATELLVAVAVSSVVMALWVFARGIEGVPARESTRRMGPAALASLALLLGIIVRDLAAAPHARTSGDPSTDLFLALPAIGFALTVLAIRAALRLAPGSRPIPASGGRWGNVAAYLLLMAISYCVSLPMAPFFLIWRFGLF